VEPRQYTMSRKDGTQIRVEIRASLVSFSGRRLVLGIARDLTARQDLERRLAESTESFAAIVDENRDGILVADSQGRIRFANPAACRFFGRPREELVGSPAGFLERADGRVEISGGPGGPAIGSVRTMTSSWGSEPATLYVVEDVTEQRELNLRQSRWVGQQTALADLGLLAVSRVALPELLQEAARRTATTLEIELCGILEARRETDEILLRAGVGWPPGSLEQTAFATDGASLEAQVLRTKEPLAVPDWRVETRFHPPVLIEQLGIISSACAAVKGDEGPYGVLTVHTRRARSFTADEIAFLQATANLLAVTIHSGGTEQRLQESERVLRESQDVGRLGGYVFDIQNGTWTSSPILDALFGIDERYPHTVAGWMELVHPDDRVDMQTYLDDVIAGAQRFERAYRVVRPADGRERWMWGIGEVKYGEDGGAVRMLGVIQDISERKRATDALTLARVELERLLAVSPTVLYQVQPEEDYATIYVSSNVEAQLGFAPTAFLDDPSFWLEHIHPDDRDRILAGLAGVPETGSLTHEYRFLHRDGRYRRLRDEVRLVRDADGKPLELVGNCSDVTEARELEAQYIQAQKMEAVGQLTGGVAHDFNNLLTAVLGYTDLAVARLPEGDPIREDLEEVRRAGERATTLTRQLLAFSRQQVLEPEVLDLGEVVTDFEKLLLRTIGEDIELATPSEVGLGSVRADPRQLEQVLLNLSVNARHAMPDGGRLEIRTANVELDEDDCAGHPSCTPGPYVMMAVTDTGHGMDEATQRRIFEPFFTTKPSGLGTGLGLSTVYGIVNQSGGHIAVDSEPGRGTTFTMYLPRVEATAEPEVAKPVGVGSDRGTETILLVEDEEPVRKVVSRMLEERGFTVHIAPDAPGALEVIELRGEGIDLVITDMVMPGGTGLELAEALAGTAAHPKVLFMSGYSGQNMFHGGEPQPHHHFLSKPFTAADLAAKVREVLDRR
jgi:two-component system, cell cycle sensor histidine kinase and response regulator CckA